MTPMRGAFDWLAVGDLAEERGADHQLVLGGAAARLTAHAAGLKAHITVVSGYSLSVEPARSAVLGALTAAGARGGRSALLLEADLLWWTNARMTRRVLEPALAAAES